MRPYCTPQALVAHFTLRPHEHDLLANQSGINRRGFVVLLQYFQWEGRFPEHWQEVPSVLVQPIAATLNLPADGIRQDELEGRTARYHQEQMRQWLGCRPGTTTDADTITAWVCAHTRVDDATLPALIERLTAR
jgi:hypothetical protein